MGADGSLSGAAEVASVNGAHWEPEVNVWVDDRTYESDYDWPASL